jgi:hypothetical protein
MTLKRFQRLPYSSRSDFCLGRSVPSIRHDFPFAPRLKKTWEDGAVCHHDGSFHFRSRTGLFFAHEQLMSKSLLIPTSRQID